MPKAYYKSKTFWFAILWILTGIANLFGFGDYAPNTKINELSAILNGFIILILRAMTWQQIYFKRPIEARWNIKRIGEKIIVRKDEPNKKNFK